MPAVSEVAHIHEKMLALDKIGVQPGPSPEDIVVECIDILPKVVEEGDLAR